MKRALLITLAMMVCAGTALADGGAIVIYSKNPIACGGTVDVCGPGLARPGFDPRAWIVHNTGPQGSLGSRWAAPVPACLNTFYSSFSTSIGTVVGNPNDGISLGYGSCQTGSFCLGTINTYYDYYGAPGADPGCCLWEVVADPGNELFDTPSSSTCTTPVGAEEARGSAGLWSATLGDPNCQCNVQNEESTWGRVKELFRRDV
jgi:hypothetical protein